MPVQRCQPTAYARRNRVSSVGAFTNPAILGEEPGDNWHAPAAVDNTCAYLNPEDFSLAFYRGTETGEVTIDGLGTGDVVLEFEGTLTNGGARTILRDTGARTWHRRPEGRDRDGDQRERFQPGWLANGVLTGQVVRPELRYVVVRNPAHGTVTVDEITGAFTYTPDPDFAQQGGADSFQVVVTENRFNLLQVFQPYNGDPVQTVNLNVTSTLQRQS